MARGELVQKVFQTVHLMILKINISVTLLFQFITVL